MPTDLLERPGSSVHRYYDPTTGQFLSVDPVVSMTGQPYAYVSGDPVNRADPLGLDPIEDEGEYYLGLSELEGTEKFAPREAQDQITQDLEEQAASEDPVSAARMKVPSDWGAGKAARTGGGWRWSDPHAKPGTNYIRVDPAKPSSCDPSQRVDHVHVVSGGVEVANHVPLDQWLGWSTWNRP